MILARHPTAALLAATLLTLAASPLEGGLEWAQREVEVKAKALDRELTGRFKFTVAGGRAVAIRSVESSCGCLVSRLPKRVFAPGESGELTAVFTVGDRVGRQVKTIRVLTDDPAQPEVTLKLKTDIPALYQASPRLVYWRRGTPPATREVTIRVNHGEPFKFTAVEPSSPRLKTELVKRQRGEGKGPVYTLKVTPEDTLLPYRGYVLLEANYPPGNPRLIKVYARIE